MDRKHFVLVHGASHGAWCWYKLAVLLESAGHAVTAIDLAASGINPSQVNEVRSMHDYVLPLMEAMDSLPPGERVVLVGHSYGGYAISLAMEASPHKISVAVFATAGLPPPNSSLSDMIGENVSPSRPVLDTKYFYDDGPDKPPTSVIFGPQMLATYLYPNSSPEDLKLATMLVRPQRIFTKETVGDGGFTDERFGSVARAFVVCKDDKLFSEDRQRRSIEKSPVNDVKEIGGSDHMVMLSKPQELFNCLLVVAEKYA